MAPHPRASLVATTNYLLLLHHGHSLAEHFLLHGYFLLEAYEPLRSDGIAVRQTQSPRRPYVVAPFAELRRHQLVGVPTVGLMTSI